MIQFLDAAPIADYLVEENDSIFIPYWILLPLVGLLVAVCMFFVFWYRKRQKNKD